MRIEVLQAVLILQCKNTWMVCFPCSSRRFCLATTVALTEYRSRRVAFPRYWGYRRRVRTWFSWSVCAGYNGRWWSLYVLLRLVYNRLCMSHNQMILPKNAKSVLRVIATFLLNVNVLDGRFRIDLTHDHFTALVYTYLSNRSPNQKLSFLNLNGLSSIMRHVVKEAKVGIYCD